MLFGFLVIPGWILVLRTNAERIIELVLIMDTIKPVINDPRVLRPPTFQSELKLFEFSQT